MPNWCANNAEFHNDEIAEVNKLEAHLKFLDEKKTGSNIETGLFSYFIPMPDEEADNWYDWNCNNWGTKWEASIYSWEKVNDNCIKLNFDTAWAPPTMFYTFLAENTEWYITATYSEPGMCFVGSNIAGEDDCYTYSSAEDVEDIPEELIEEYNLRDQFEDDEDFDEEDEEVQLENLKTEFEALMTADNTEKNAFADEVGREWLRGLLKEQAIEVTFIKKDGTQRLMKCTLSKKIVPQAENSSNSTKTHKHSAEAQPVYDIEAKGWRSFRWDSVKQINFSLGK